MCQCVCECVLCTSGGEGGLMEAGGGKQEGWGRGVSPTILTMYKKGAYKNVQGGSSVFPENTRPPSTGSNTTPATPQPSFFFVFLFICLFLSTIENMLFL